VDFGDVLAAASAAQSMLQSATPVFLSCSKPFDDYVIREYNKTSDLILNGSDLACIYPRTWFRILDCHNRQMDRGGYAGGFQMDPILQQEVEAVDSPRRSSCDWRGGMC